MALLFKNCVSFKLTNFVLEQIRYLQQKLAETANLLNSQMNWSNSKKQQQKIDNNNKKEKTLKKSIELNFDENTSENKKSNKNFDEVLSESKFDQCIFYRLNFFPKVVCTIFT